MQSEPSNKPRQLLIGALLVFMAIPVGFVGLMIHSITDSHKDYERVESCLQQHGFAVQDGWKHTDLTLEDFGLIFEVSNGQQWEVQILDGSWVRNCRDRVAGLFLSNVEIGTQNKQYLPLDNPALREALQEQKIRTLEDVFAQLEWLLTWAEANPNALLARDEVANPRRYVNLLSPPL